LSEHSKGPTLNTAEWNENASVLVESPLARIHRNLMIRRTRLEELLTDRSARVLDLGCGSGPFLAYFASRGFGELYGVEPEEALIEKIPEPLRGRVRADKAEQLSFEDGFFDAVFVYCVLHHLKGDTAYREACAEIDRVLKPGGLVFIVEPGRYKTFLALEAASAVLGLVSKTFRALYATMVEERPEQHHFLRNHHVVREALEQRRIQALVDDYFIYSWIYTARKP
jgi:SAM-dependent methyltransferase